ncbi:MAG: histidinol phosphate phosphatase domain-containing protein [Chloroflexi bacterium]|nr:histidinol phosphate phosphatase domain-containing protein [Chloroflexota bacterium]
MYDFHTHTLLSDGELSPLELIARAQASGYSAIALTDHVGLGSLERVVREIAADCALARKHWDILAIPGVELTYVPPAAIPEAARQAKELGAWLVVVHGETVVEPVPKGTNKSALSSPHVDILAHPGLLSIEEARSAGQQGVFLEISARSGHSLTNGHVYHMASLAGARLLLNSDAHRDSDLLTEPFAQRVAQGAGLSNGEIRQALYHNPHDLLDKLPRHPE